MTYHRLTSVVGPSLTKNSLHKLVGKSINLSPLVPIHHQQISYTSTSQWKRGFDSPPKLLIPEPNLDKWSTWALRARKNNTVFRNRKKIRVTFQSQVPMGKPTTTVEDLNAKPIGREAPWPRVSRPSNG